MKSDRNGVLNLLPVDDWLRPAWAQPGVEALMTTRNGGASQPPFDSFNLRTGIGDDDAGAVAANLGALRSHLAADPVWLDQVHGSRVVRLVAGDAQPGKPKYRADASVTTEPGLACMVQVADCLPVLMAARSRGVAAAHAGWRGLAAGVLGATVEALCQAVDCRPDDIEAWLGACIGPRHFEVGGDVLTAFGVDPAAHGGGQASRFERSRERSAGKWLADLPGLAQDRLFAAGVRRISAVGLCTFEETSQFFSYRRDHVTGRMAAGIWLTG